MTISVATPSFNQLDWLRLCVASVRDQVAPHSPCSAIRHPPSATSTLCVEHIIQDAGSPGIEDFAREVSADFYRDGQLIFRSQISGFSVSRYQITIYCESDGGMYDAINRAWSRSRGDVLCYLNCDEQYLPGGLERVAKELERRKDADIIIGDAVIIDTEGNLLSYRRVVRPTATHTRIVHLGTMSCAMFFRRKLFENGLCFDTKWKAIGDAEWVFRALAQGPGIKLLRKPLAAFTLTGQNLGSDPKALREADLWRSTAPKMERRLAVIWKAYHFAKKLMAGAYVRRDLKTVIYQQKDPTQRVIVEAHKLAFSWPRAANQ